MMKRPTNMYYATSFIEDLTKEKKDKENPSWDQETSINAFANVAENHNTGWITLLLYWGQFRADEQVISPPRHDDGIKVYTWYADEKKLIFSNQFETYTLFKYWNALGPVYHLVVPWCNIGFKS